MPPVYAYVILALVLLTGLGGLTWAALKYFWSRPKLWFRGVGIKGTLPSFVDAIEALKTTITEAYPAQANAILNLWVEVYEARESLSGAFVPPGAELTAPYVPDAFVLLPFMKRKFRVMVHAAPVEAETVHRVFTCVCERVVPFVVAKTWNFSNDPKWKALTSTMWKAYLLEIGANNPKEP